LSQPKPRTRAMTKEQLANSLVLPRRALVEVRRDMTESIAKLVYEHEIDVLREVHGEGNVTVIDDPLKHNILIGPPDVIDAARVEAQRAAKRGQRVVALFMHTEHPMRKELIDENNEAAGHRWVMDPVFVGDEMQRLRTVYGMHHEKKEAFVDAVYPHEMDFVEACGGLYKPEDYAESPARVEVKGAA
jgi:hypothetical protein